MWALSRGPFREIKTRFQYKAPGVVLQMGLRNKTEACYQLIRKTIERVADRILNSKVSANVSPPGLYFIITWEKLKQISLPTTQPKPIKIRISGVEIGH